MAAFRAISSGVLQIGMAVIPVKVYKGIESPDKTTALHQVHAGTCNGEVGRKNWCKTCNTEVTSADIARAASGVIIPTEVLDEFRVESDKTIRIDEFVPLSSIDLRLVDEPRYISADKGGQDALRAFADTLLARAEAGEPVAGIGKTAEREREKVIALTAIRDTVSGGAAIVLYVLRWSDEVRAATPIAQAVAEGKAPTTQLVGMVNSLIDAMSAEGLDASKYTDEKGRARDEAIRAIIAGGTPVIQSVTEAAPTVDLMAALSASVTAAQAARTPAAPRKTTRKSTRAA